MDSHWKSYGAPLAVVLATSVWAFCWARLAYGVDLVNEARHVLYQLDLLAGEGFFHKELALDQLAQLLVFPGVKVWRAATGNTGAEAEGLVLFLREFRLISAIFVCGVLTFFFRHRVPLSMTLLFCAPVIAFLPLGLPGVHPLSMGSLMSALLLILAWRWFQQPTYVKSWLLPLAACFLVIALPETLPLVVVGLVVLMLRRSREGEPRLVKVHLAASLNLTLIIGFFAIRATNAEGFQAALDLQSRVLGWPWQQLGHWQWPGQNMLLIFVLLLILSLTFPARYFHPFFAALCASIAFWNWSSGEMAAENLVVLMAPLVLSHFWKIRKALPPDFKLSFVVVSSLLFAIVLLMTRGTPGMAVGLLPLYLFFFASGWVRELKFSVAMSAFVFSMLLVVAQFMSLPPNQTRNESLDQVSRGAYRGLWTSRPVSVELEAYLKAFKDLPPGPGSVFVYDNMPGIYLLTALERATFLYGAEPNAELHREYLSFFSDAANLPDVVIEVTKLAQQNEASEPFANFFESHQEYRRLEESPRFRNFIKVEFVEQAMKQN